VAPAVDYEASTPKFCFRHIVNGYDVQSLSKDQRSNLALTLQQRAQLTWQQIRLADRHGQGTEFMPKESIKPSVPVRFTDQERFLVFRYCGNLPMVGVRVLDVFHILWIENAYGRVYDH
jgi:hypothetical protein